jgi:hypothetical protein
MSVGPSAPAVEGSFAGHRAAKQRGYHLEIFAVSLAGLLLEISYTRIVSFKLFYYFTYLVIGLALLGLGAGGVLVAVSERLRRSSTDAILSVSLAAGTAIVFVGYLVVAAVPINTLVIWRYDWRTVTNGTVLLVLCLIMFASFVPAGIVISTLFGRQPERIGRLYCADLLGAGLACVIAVPLAGSIGPPAIIMLAGLVLAVSSLRTGSRIGANRKAIGVLLAALLAVFVASPGLLPDVRLDSGKVNPDVSSLKSVYSSWSPLFRIDVRQGTNRRFLFHDGLLGSIMLQWDGNPATLTQFGFDDEIAALPFSAGAAHPANELIIGAAAGREVDASLYFNAAHIDAVELNPVTYRLVTHAMAGYDGHVAQNPRVNYVNADGRSFLARSDKKYNLVWFPAPDSYSATNASSASAFVLSESYLYTSNAIKDTLEHLAPDGELVAQFGEIKFNALPNRTVRYVQTARAALRQLGINDPADHIMVSTSPGGILPDVSTIVIKRTPFTAAETQSFGTTLTHVHGSRLAYAPGRVNPPSKVASSVELQGPQLSSFLSNYHFSVDSINDDKPFFWHFTPFTSVLRDLAQPIRNPNVEVAVGERVLILLLALAVVLSLVFLIGPFVSTRSTRKRLPHRWRGAAYFAALGFGFMFFEIPLIQRFVLFLGYPTYSLTVTLSSLLIFVGIGSFLSPRLLRSRQAPFVLWIAVVAIAIYYLFGLTPTTNALLDLPLLLRVPIAFAFLAPLGLCLGVFMPLGLGAIAASTESPTEYVAWAWALNGFASVTGSVLATMLAMTWGFNIVLVFAIAAYTVAVLAIRSLSAAPPARAVVRG